MGAVSPDLVADASNASWPGLVAIELKAFGHANLDAKVGKATGEFEANFAKGGEKYASGLLLVTVVSGRKIVSVFSKRFVGGQWVEMETRAQASPKKRRRVLIPPWAEAAESPMT